MLPRTGGFEGMERKTGKQVFRTALIKPAVIRDRLETIARKYVNRVSVDQQHHFLDYPNQALNHHCFDYNHRELYRKLTKICAVISTFLISRIRIAGENHIYVRLN